MKYIREKDIHKVISGFAISDNLFIFVNFFVLFRTVSNVQAPFS